MTQGPRDMFKLLRSTHSWIITLDVESTAFLPVYLPEFNCLSAKLNFSIFYPQIFGNLSWSIQAYTALEEKN